MPSLAPRDDDTPPRRRRKEDEPSSPRDKERPKTKHSSRTASKSTSSLKIPRQRKSTGEELEREREVSSPRSIPSLDKVGGRLHMAAPEMDRTASGEIRAKSQYPNFSKAHSREAVGSREELPTAKGGPLTPEATEIGGEKGKKRRNSAPGTGLKSTPTRAPPSPPLTAEDPDVRPPGSSNGTGKTAEEVILEDEGARKSAAGTPQTRVNNASRSNLSLRNEARFVESDISSMPGAFPEEERKSTASGDYHRTMSTGSQPTSSVTDTTTDSDATSVAPERKGQRPSRLQHTQRASPPLASGSPGIINIEKQPLPFRPKTPIIDVGGANAYNPQAFPSDLNPKTPLTAVPAVAVPPPPPPPPALDTSSTQRVDYLLKNGGLPTLVPRRLVPPNPVQQYSMYQSPAIGSIAPAEEYAKLFGSLHKRLDDYLFVLRNNGSLAVATGYKSVARRLLDKLSQVFARDISSQRCDCVICRTTPQPILSDEEDTGVSWGEILEFVSGRSVLPQWPPFAIQPDDTGLGIVGATTKPMQKLDIDVPEEYKEHYIRQNQKTKRVVENWLAHQPEFPSSPPEEADEDTLMFAMMTKLDAQQRNFFIALMHGHSQISTSRAPTPAERPTTLSDALRRTKKALQRLYRLDRAPRDCEAAIYLLNNFHLHGMLATLAEVNEQEWDILVSGRFDGFLWSGAEAAFPPSVSAYASPVASRGPSRGPNGGPSSRNTTPFSGMSSAVPSRGPTPFNQGRSDYPGFPSPQQYPPSVFPSRGPTPGINGIGVAPPAPVQLDEDTEIAVLAEVERNLFNDMERFEDAFEVLHSRAELVRQLLRERSTGLSLQSQMRRGSNASDIGVRLDTPASGITDFEEEDDDDGLADMVSLAPDDSASQISVNRRHRKRERQERRTPAPVAEEDESTFEEHAPPSHHRHGGRRSKY